MRKMQISRRWFRLGCALWPLVAAINLIAPFLVKYAVNKALKKIPGFKGHLYSVQAGFMQHRVKLAGFCLDRIEPSTKKPVPFITMPFADIKLDRAALWHGVIKCSVEAERPEVTFTKDFDFGVSPSLNIEFNLANCSILNGRISFVDITATPVVELEVNEINITGWTEDEKLQKLPLKINVTAAVCDGNLKAGICTNLDENSPTFDLNAELRGVNMFKLNTFFKAYGNFDVAKGTLEMFSEVAAADGRFTGYVKPFIEGLEVLGPQDKNDGFVSRLLELLIGAANELLKNHEEDELSTKICFEGKFSAPKINIGYAIIETLRNAFVRGLTTSIDREINITSVKKTN